jgi:hypothetical protein
VLKKNAIVLEFGRHPQASDESFDIILAGVVFVFYILKIGGDGEEIIERNAPVGLGDLRLVEVVFAVQIRIAQPDIVLLAAVPFTGDFQTA